MRETSRGRSTVDVWVAALRDDETGPWLAHLDATEQARAATLPDQQRSRFVQARALLRGVLGERLGCSARAVELHVACSACGGPHGPVTLAADIDLFTSITRAGARIGVALTDAGAVGVDIESFAAISAARLADVALSGRALAAHARRRPSARTRALATSWVSAEAALKATGTGLRTSPADLEIHSRRGRRTALAPDGTWALLAGLDLGPGLAGAVALVPGGPWSAEHTGRDPAAGPHRLTVRLHDGDAVLTDLSESQR
ncbi:4'-phosphopantetheinyl transferase superfamily protein [Actinotalea sp. K2]|uniref:4'-phosphopantetheinyl transferase family protein n=1 Tax=Actinotalea sp. K2 TaxID=2939438 RepID=UPI002016AEED|nr:4'-phosphopantetheinyl transferase superfamily protein [Actinotalea sp. K2]MCL3861171.1 4'-phosphopantetheinyl transferase superfamily protein [Actinotalea sp. K2]